MKEIKNIRIIRWVCASIIGSLLFAVVFGTGVCSALTLENTIEATSNAKQVYSENRYLYIANSSHPITATYIVDGTYLKMYDTTNVSNITLIAEYNAGYPIMDFFVNASYNSTYNKSLIYIAVWQVATVDRVLILNSTNLNFIRQNSVTGSMDAYHIHPDLNGNVWISGFYGVRIYNNITSTVLAEMACNGAAGSGGMEFPKGTKTAYVNCYDDGIKIFDYSNYSSIVTVSHAIHTTYSRYGDFFINETYLYADNSYAGQANG